MCGCRHRPVETVVKMPGTVGGAADGHLPEQHEDKDGDGYNTWLKFARESTVRFCAPAEDRTGTGPEGPPYAATLGKSRFRRSR